MARSHLKFRNFRPEVIDAAKALFDRRPSQLPSAERVEVGQHFADAICAAFRVAPAKVVQDPYMRSGYRPAIFEQDSLSDEPREVTPSTLQLGRRFSIIVLFKLVRIHVLALEGANATTENDPWDWACSLFYTVKPILFRKLVREGRIKRVTARDTFSSDSWEKLVAANLTFGERVIGNAGQIKAALDGVEYVEPEVADPADVGAISDSEMEQFFEEVEDAEDDEDDDDVTIFDDEDVMTDDELDQNDSEPEAAVVPINVDIASLNRDGLRALAAQIELPGRGSMNAGALRDALLARQESDS